MTRTIPDRLDLMTPAEVAAIFGVQAKTVAAWSRAGRLDAVRTLGGHRRYRREEVENLLGPRRAAAVLRDVQPVPVPVPDEGAPEPVPDGDV